MDFFQNKLGPDARLWVFALESALAPEAEAMVREELEKFVTSWKAHGHPVRGAADVIHGRFVVLAADPKASDVSGCSIDGMFRAVSTAAAAGGAAIADLSKVFYRNEAAGIDCVTREEFSARAKAGRISAETPVFDNTVQTLGDLTGRWEKPLRESWHRQLVEELPA